MGDRLILSTTIWRIGCDRTLDHSGTAAGSYLITGHADYSSVQSQLVTPLVIREFSID